MEMFGLSLDVRSLTGWEFRHLLDLRQERIEHLKMTAGG